MGNTPVAKGRSPLEVGVLITLAALAFAGVVGFIAVLDADSRSAGFGTGLGIAFLIFFTGSTIACALACLTRRRLELVALGAIVASCLSIDLLVLAVWLEIDYEVYAKVAGVAFGWSFFALVILGLALAVGAPQRLARSLYVGAVASAVVAGLISTWLVMTAGGDVEVTASEAPNGGAFGVDPFGLVGDDDLLQALGAILVLLAALWFGALAASRLERPPLADVTR